MKCAELRTSHLRHVGGYKDDEEVEGEPLLVVGKNGLQEYVIVQKGTSAEEIKEKSGSSGRSTVDSGVYNAPEGEALSAPV